MPHRRQNRALADREIPQLPHDFTAATAGVAGAGWRISRLEAAHIASVELRDMSAARASTGADSGDELAWAGAPVGQRGPVGHWGGAAGAVGVGHTGWTTESTAAAAG
ncbi:MAG: hypothetical protein V4515_02665 [Chloroflexota bacterium]